MSWGAQNAQQTVMYSRCSGSDVCSCFSVDALPVLWCVQRKKNKILLYHWLKLQTLNIPQLLSENEMSVHSWWNVTVLWQRKTKSHTRVQGKRFFWRRCRRSHPVQPGELQWLAGVLRVRSSVMKGSNAQKVADVIYQINTLQKNQDIVKSYEMLWKWKQSSNCSFKKTKVPLFNFQHTYTMKYKVCLQLGSRPRKPTWLWTCGFSVVQALLCVHGVGFVKCPTSRLFIE